MNYSVYQLKKDVDYKFMDYDFAVKHGFNFERDYVKTYREDLGCDYINEQQIYEILEVIFIRFNQDKPEDFKGHSLSTSDVVKIDNRSFYCDSFGWVEIK